MASLGAELPDLPGSIEKRTPIGGKLIIECFKGADGNTYADLLLVYASAEQLRAISTLTYDNPPMAVKIPLSGLSANADGLYRLTDLDARFAETMAEYDAIEDATAVAAPARVIPISEGRSYTLSGTQANDSTRGIVISDHQKVVRK